MKESMSGKETFFGKLNQISGVNERKVQMEKL